MFNLKYNNLRKKIFLFFINIFIISFCFGQKNIVKGIGGIWATDGGFPYLISVAFERTISKHSTLQLTYTTFYTQSEDGYYTEIYKIIPEYRYYINDSCKHFNWYGILYDEYFIRKEHGWSYNDDFTSSYDYDNFYYLNGIGIGFGIQKKLSKRFVFDINIGPKYYYYANNKDALKNRNYITPYKINGRFGIRFCMFLGFYLF